MKTPDPLKTVLERIVNSQQSEADLEVLRDLMRQGDAQNLLSQYNINIGQITGGDVQVGDRTYTVEWNDEAMQALVKTIQDQAPKPTIDKFVRCQPRTALLTSLGVTTFILLVRFLGILQPHELNVYDHLIQTRLQATFKPEALKDDRLAIIKINDEDLKKQEKRGEELDKDASISNASLMKLLQKLNRAKPLAIGLDLYRDVSLNTQKYSDLAKAFQTQPNLFMICKVMGKPNEDSSYEPPPGAPMERVGFSDFITDEDDVLRRQLLAFRLDAETKKNIKSECKSDRSFNLLLASHYLQQKQNITTNNPFTDKDICAGIKFSNGTTLPNIRFFTGGYQGLANPEGCQILLNYRTNQKDDIEIAPSYNLESVLEQDASDLAKSFRDRIVLIGTVRPNSRDFWSTPFDQEDKKMTGVDLQAQMVSHLLDAVSGKSAQRPLIWVLPQWAEALWILAWSLVGAGLGWWWRSPQSLIIAVGLGCAILYGSCIILFICNGWIPLLPSGLVLVITSATVWVWTFRRNLSDAKVSHKPSAG
jgi:CHASE2 domain-containing sensor protein